MERDKYVVEHRPQQNSSSSLHLCSNDGLLFDALGSLYDAGSHKGWAPGIRARFNCPNCEHSRQFLANAGTEYALYGRYSLAGNNPNTTGILLALGIPLAWYLAASAGGGKVARLLRIVNYAYIPAITFAMILTATRFAVIMSLPAFIFGLWTFSELKPVSRMLIFVALMAALLTLGSKVPGASLQRLSTINEEIQEGNLNDRTELWKVGVDIWLEHPILGIGSAGYNTAVVPIYGRPRSVHNSFIAISAELGIIGLGLFGIILVTAVFQAWCQPTRLDGWFWLTVLITWGLGNLALTWTYNKPTWLLLSLLAASASLSRQHDKSGSRIGPSNGNTASATQEPPIAAQALRASKSP